ncbi:uncharacterized protein LOC117792642 [Drosophila innubila]|uniref:uncharacterized protein LOC117792642 n=1 Tax=Drosophila innubila TaxID=198719 RepID=UPI00148B800E|nr:uncharacterized protein LOC117792642 [Drosophila innubila]
MSNEANQDSSAKPTSVSSSLPNSTDPPTFKQIYATLRFCLRYANSTANIFNRLITLLETTDIITITSMLPKEELERFVPMMAQRMTRIRMDIGDIGKFKTLSQAGGVSELPLIRRCDLVPPKLRRSDANKSGQLMILGQLLPRLEHLNMQASIADPFPVNLRHLHTLIVHQSVYQEMLDRICDNCPLLQQLYVRNEARPNTSLDIAHIVKCEQLRDLQLPLMLHTPVAVCYLKNLKTLTLQRQQLWPDMDWLPIVRDIINAKRDSLQRLSLDGAWLTIPLDLHLLQLYRCWALRDVLLSNCKLADPTGHVSLPLSCQRFSLMDCSVSTPLYFLRNSAQMQLLELHKCQFANRGGKLLMELLKQRQRLPILNPLQLHFSDSTPLRSELLSWDQKQRQAWEECLQIRELNDYKMNWKQKLATIIMTFGDPVNYTPDLDQLNEFSHLTPAELLRDL